MVSGGCFRGWAGDPIPAAGYELVKLGIAKNGSGKPGKILRWFLPGCLVNHFPFVNCQGAIWVCPRRHRYPQILYFTHPSCHLGAPYVWRKPFGDRSACLIKLFKDMIASGFTVRYGKIIIYTRYINCDCNLLEGIPMTIPYVIPIKSLLMVKSVKFQTWCWFNSNFNAGEISYI